MNFKIETKKESYFLSQPHQPFFTLGIVGAIVMMLIFALSYKGIFSLQTEILNFHVYTMVFIVFTNMFTGFLFTTFPRFCQSQVITKKYYKNIFYSTALGSTIFLVGSFLNHSLMFMGMILLFISQLFMVLKLRTIYKTGNAIDKKDAFWILNAQYFGILGHLLFLVIELEKYFDLNLNLINIATNISFYMFLIFLAFSVAQRMIPFFSHSFTQKNTNFVKIIFVLFILKTIFANTDFKIVEIVVDLIIGSYMVLEFKRWELHPFNSPAILWVLHLALLWLPLAFLLSAISLTAEIFLDTSFYFLNIHLLAIGFLTTVLIGFGTRVTLGHSGQSPQADRLASNIFWFVQVVVLLRDLYSINIAFGWGLNFLFDISFSAWLILFLVWGARYGKVLVFGTKL